MAATLISPKYSFVSFNNEQLQQNCSGPQNYVLPVIEESDLRFQFIVKTDSSFEADVIMGMNDNEFQLALLEGVGNISLPLFQNLLVNFTIDHNLYFVRTRIADDKILFTWSNNLTGLVANLFDKDCFELCMYIPSIELGGPPQSIAKISNPFVRLANKQYTTVLDYYNTENYTDFDYCDVPTFTNRARLHLDVSRPKYPEDKSVYRKSNGEIILRKSVISKEYNVTTEHYNELLHEKIIVALSHDFVQINNPIYSGGISKNSTYDIDWNEDYNMCSAPASFKILATPLVLKNNSCGECTSSYVPLPLPFMRYINTILSSSFGNQFDIVFEAVNFTFNPTTAIITHSMDEGATWIPVINLSQVTSSNPWQFHYTIDATNFQSHFIKVQDTMSSALPLIFYFSIEYSQVFIPSSITNSSFTITQGFDAGVTWDLSLDGGLNFIATNITTETYNVTGLTANTTYQVVRRMKSTNGIVQSLPPQSITTTA